ncbi:hypothetical protein L226DRAFT_574812 [Lentinus tigrinus ALCF2SS1-7]|uniref:CUE domain-containing protein n=1 Tax=Lentinus tigrinus ALCF2SS1-6 TaxID=1328759 RepID=A0A5C2RUP6_9APHY|nr:hypothetical protein L227DRAFT_615892 [Lentinus tigrinus ALCF2SS1-6]RPD70498.1 hypothetical protein L226DRAFT_574812 [Lentinus tigrinus ALCF2SS1-7]
MPQRFEFLNSITCHVVLPFCHLIVRLLLLDFVLLCFVIVFITQFLGDFFIFFRLSDYPCKIRRADDDRLLALEPSGRLRLVFAFSASMDAARGHGLDEWERLFLETKVALNTFHVLAEPAFEVIFDLLELPSGAGAYGLSPTPFLNRPLFADYQHAYDFSKTLPDVFRRPEDARTNLMKSSLRSRSEEVASRSREPGALKLILRSSGIQPDIVNLGRGPASKPPADDVKGKEMSRGRRRTLASDSVPGEHVDMTVAQVLELLSGQDPGWIRYLLSHDNNPYRGDAERLLAALLDAPAPKVEEFTYTKERRNSWDEENMDLAQVRIGKKSGDAEAVLEDRSFIEQMKADILRRAEEGKAIAFEDELDDADRVVVRDGHDSDDDQEGTEAEEGGRGTDAVRVGRFKDLDGRDWVIYFIPASDIEEEANGVLAIVT